MKRLIGNRRGGVSLITAGGLPMLLGFAAFAVDVGSITLETRKLQGIADAAALAAAVDPAHAQSLAEASVAAAGWRRAITVQATSGSYLRDATVAASARFAADPYASDAVHVALTMPSPTFFGRIFGQQAVTIGRVATAARQRLAAFSIGSRLASLNGGLINAYLSALTGSTVSLSVMDYNALAGADVDLFGVLDALHTTAHLQALTFEDVLDAQVTRGQALEAIATTLDAGNPTEAAAMRKLAMSAGGGSLSLGALIDAGAMGKQATGGAGVAKVNALAMATAMLQLASPSRQVSLDLGAGVAGLASTRVTIAIGERPANSPWIAITDNGTPVIRTAQARVYLDTQTANLSLPGIGTLASVRVPLFTELASAEGRLSNVDCSTAASRGVTVEARPSPGQAAIATVDTSRLNDFSTPLALGTARLVDTLLVDVDGSAQVDLGASEQWQRLRFDAAAISAGTTQTVSSGTVTQSIAASLVGRVALTVRVLGLPIPTAPLTQAVGTQLGLVAPALDTLIDTATGTLGVHFGEADVRVTGMRCGTAALVG